MYASSPNCIIHCQSHAQEEEMPYSFFVNEQEMVKGLFEVLERQAINDEEVLRIEYQPQAVFRVRQITRCVSSMEGML
jgi:ribosome assembly protein 4